MRISSLIWYHSFNKILKVYANAKIILKWKGYFINIKKEQHFFASIDLKSIEDDNNVESQ